MADRRKERMEVADIHLETQQGAVPAEMVGQ